eukprot:TRINITY_DN5938_c0_g1_i1.p1 TRINITY_DN5938_c0_g1~~TRINITY_DN5938_c0_g1_i1.p1  ORF type:complete len:196 (+),score=43.24 TRINITY_DN5938_c0_g1_i1:43-588(+)
MHKSYAIEYVKEMIFAMLDPLAGEWDNVDKDDLYQKIITKLLEISIDARLFESVSSMAHMCSESDKFLVLWLPGSSLESVRDTLVVDLHFKGRFSLIRASQKYALFYDTIEPAFVGTAASLHKSIKIVCAEMAYSFKVSGMELPPWRTEAVYKNSYDFQNKSKVQQASVFINEPDSPLSSA